MPDTQKKILIIDDDADFREIFSAKLKAAGFSVDTAPGGEEGMKKAKELKPDLILLDVQMPRTSGTETLAKLKGDDTTSDIDVIFLTSFGEAKDDAQWLDKKFAQEAGALDHMRKSDELDTIVNKIKEKLSPS